MSTWEYDDAYTTPGWTAQNFAYPPPVGSVPPPPLPVGVRRVAISQTYLTAAGKPQRGNVRIRRFTSRVTDGTVIGPYDDRVDLVNGRLVTELLTAGTGWYYQVYEAFPGGRRYRIRVPMKDDPTAVVSLVEAEVTD